MKVRASCMNWTVARLCTPIVSMPMTADGSVSYKQKVEPYLFSMSKLIDSSLHMWKSVLYWMRPKPGWCKKLQNMNPRSSDCDSTALTGADCFFSAVAALVSAYSPMVGLSGS